MKFLIEKGIDVNATEKGSDHDGWTALMFLCEKYTQDNMEEIVEILIDSKINVNAKSSKDGLTAVDILRRRNFADDSSLVQLLLAQTN